MTKSTQVIFTLLCMITTITFSQNNGNGLHEIKFEKELVENEAIAEFLSANNLSKDNTYKLIRTTTDRMGNTHSRYQQYYKGIKVEFGTLIIHKKGELVQSINAESYNASGLNLSPKLNSQESLLKSIKHLGIKKASWYNNVSKSLSKENPVGELVIVPNYKDKLKSVVLAYKFKIETSAPFLIGYSYINANTGSSELFNPIAKHLNIDSGSKSKEVSSSPKTKQNHSFTIASGNADTRYLGNQSIETRAETDGTYTLNDDVNKIHTRNAKHFTKSIDVFTKFTEFIDDDNNWTKAEHDNAEKDNAALDAHFGAMKVKEYWDIVHGRNSYDDKGAPLYSYVHYGVNKDIAGWTGKEMIYGDSDASSTGPLTAFDVCAHEIGHAVTQSTADLVYANQSGGLNEGFSDIWGAAIQHYTYGTGTDTAPDPSVWAIGEDIKPTGIRSMSNPKSHNDPDTYLGTNWVTTADDGDCIPGGNDHCGVHTNSGVLNHWFYILTQGKVGTNDVGSAYDVTGIGMKKAEEIAYLMLRDYLTPNSTYLQARDASLAVASNLYCYNSSEFKEIQNAWYAVNVGEQYKVADNDISLNKVTHSASLECGTTVFVPHIKIHNSGANPITSFDLSYTIDGGAPTNKTVKVNIDPCKEIGFDITSIGTLPRGVHTLKVTTTIASDDRDDNNTKSSIIVVNESGKEDEINSFESTNDALITYNNENIFKNESLWERGIPTGTVLNDPGNNVYATNLDGNYTEKTKAYLISQCYDLSKIKNAVLKFKMGFDLAYNGDVFYVEYSIDGGDKWKLLGTATDPNWYNSDKEGSSGFLGCNTCVGGQWTGKGGDAHGTTTNADLNEYSYSLSAFDGNAAVPATNILFRYTISTDDSYTFFDREGVIIDDLVVEGEKILGIEKNELGAFSYFPNPVQEGLLHLALNPNNTNGNIKINLFDLSGRNVYSKSQPVTSDFKTTLELHNLSSGMYLMDISQGSDNELVKVLVK